MEKKKSHGRYVPIEDYGVIGNLHTVALVSREGSIDFMSFPRFDSPTVFCKILDADNGGFFSISPVMEDMVLKQLYLPDTNILVTRFLSEEGIAEMIDYMPVIDEEVQCTIVRKVTTVRGKIKYQMECFPAFDYARDTHAVLGEQDKFIF